MNFVKNLLSFPFAAQNATIPFGKIGLVLGSVAMGQWLLSDIAHIPGGGLGIVVVGTGIWWLFQTDKPKFDAPKTVHGWISRCHEVIEQFQLLEDQEEFLKNRQQRVNTLDEIINRSEPQKLAFASTNDFDLPSKEQVYSFLDLQSPLDISYQETLPIRNENWLLPNSIQVQDALIYVLPLPLRAADLLWLKKIPEDQPSWLLVLWKEESLWSDELNDLKAQLPDRWSSRILRWKGSYEEIPSLFKPVTKLLSKPQLNIEITKQRLLSNLHVQLQSDLEDLRRDKFKFIQNRSQWVVAGAVFTSPIPSGDLLAVAVVNGLMIQEMASIWSCKVKPDLLKVVARTLASAAVAQGVVEWSGQALLGVAKLHGGAWVAAGSMQALSAAYLTRVVGRSMADWMALNNGVSELDLELLNQQASKLVAQAAEKERLDWIGFMKQGKNWIEDQIKESNINKQLLGT